MGRHFSLSLVLVANNDVVVVNGKPLVGVYGDTEETGVGVDQEQLVARLQIVDDGGLGQVGHVGHVLEQLVLGRVLGLDVVSLEHLHLAVDEPLDLDLAVFLRAGSLTQSVTSLGVGNPTGSFAFKWSISLNGVIFVLLTENSPDINQLHFVQTKVDGRIASCFGIPKRHV